MFNVRRGPMVLASTAIAALTLAGCSGAGGDSSSGETLTLGLNTDWTGWDPAKLISAGSLTWIEQGVWDHLLTCDATGAVEPGAAESFEVADQNTVFTLHLREGMTFSDGSDVDASDVAATLDYMIANGVNASQMEGVTTEAVDDLTVTLTAASPSPLVPGLLCTSFGVILPSEVIESGNFSGTPVGSGPYTYDEASSTVGAEYVLQRNDAYPDSETYPFDTVRVKVITDSTARLNALKAGDIAGAQGSTAVVAEAESAGLDNLKLNGAWAGLLLTDRNGTVVPALGEVDVRRAINMVFDKEQIASTIYQGLATPTAEVFRPGTAAYISDLKDPYPFDVDAAKSLMAEAGYADGFDIELPVVSDAGAALDPIYPLIVQQLGLLGIRAEIVTLSGPNAISDLLSGRFPMIFWPLGNQGNSYQDLMSWIVPDAVWNVQRASDPRLQELLDQIPTADETESSVLQKQVNEFLIDEAWFAPMVYPDQIFTFDPKQTTLNESSDASGLAPNLRDFETP
ncbi:ABC transporter substrate-binding protein [Microbacterium sp. NPDC091313]